MREWWGRSLCVMLIIWHEEIPPNCLLLSTIQQVIPYKINNKYCMYFQSQSLTEFSISRLDLSYSLTDNEKV